MVEGWGEELFLPTLSRIAKRAGLFQKDVTESGISIINIGNTAFLRYSKIFLRKDSTVSIPIPVALITDLDVHPSKENELVNGLTRKQLKSQKKAELTEQNIITFISPYWTFEYCLALSHLFRRELFIATRLAGRQMELDIYSGKKIDITWDKFAAGKTDLEIAGELYEEIIIGKKISKSIISQYLSEIIFKKRIFERSITKRSLCKIFT